MSLPPECPMKVLVAVKRVIDFNVKIRVNANRTDVDTANVKFSINPFDEIAVEEAVRLKEKGNAKEVVAVTIGAAPCQDVLRAALAIGADRAIHVVHDSPLQPLDVAKLLKAIVLREQPQLVVLGKQAIDDDCNQTGQMLASLLGWPQGTFASRLDVAPDEVMVTREVDGGLETLALKPPCVVTTDLRLNTPRYASLPNIMKAKKKPIESLTAEALGVTIAPHLVTLKVEEPPARQGGRKLASVQELVEKLRNEARVL
jgi:electron transfer flavoprotein beta subunit